MLSVIIPVLNAEDSLPRVLDSLISAAVSGLVREVILVDGGSSDATCAIAEATGARLLHAKPGRGGQLAAGAVAAKSDWLMFLHADTVLSDNWEEEVARFVKTQDSVRPKAGVFRFALNDFARGARFLEMVVRMRCKLFALPYGDQGLVIGRHFYNNLGGFARLPLMEDVDMIRRIGRRRLTFFRSRAITSAERYRRNGYVMRPVRNMFLLALYFLRVPPRVLVKLYG